MWSIGTAPSNSSNSPSNPFYEGQDEGYQSDPGLDNPNSPNNSNNLWHGEEEDEAFQLNVVSDNPHNPGSPDSPDSPDNPDNPVLSQDEGLELEGGLDNPYNPRSSQMCTLHPASIRHDSNSPASPNNPDSHAHPAFLKDRGYRFSGFSHIVSITLDDSCTPLEVIKVIREVFSIPTLIHGGSVITVINAFDEQQTHSLELGEFHEMLVYLGIRLSRALSERVYNSGVFRLNSRHEIGYFEFIQTVSYP